MGIIVFNAFRGLRNALFSIAPRIAADLLACETVHEVEEILNAALTTAIKAVDFDNITKGEKI